jgi:hypothetical protein
LVSENAVNRMHWAQRKRLLDPWKDAAAYSVMSLGPSLKKALAGRSKRVQVYLPFRTRRKRDPHNYVGTVCKAIIDGLVIGGLWPDDNPSYVSLEEPKLAIYTNFPPHVAPPVEIILTPLVVVPADTKGRT